MNTIELRKLKKATEKLSKWETSGKAFGHYTVIEAKATTTDGADRIYEFYCVLRILVDLATHYTITLIPGTSSGKIFPQAPSLKKGWPYFVIERIGDASNKFQVCYGTKIKLSKAPSSKMAPDISFQKYNATDDPDESMVDLIMDAKFKYDNTAALPVDQINDFMQRVNALDTKNADTIPLLFNKMKALKSNCLLTNGKAVAKHKDYCILYKVKQVEEFDLGKTFNVIG